MPNPFKNNKFTERIRIKPAKKELLQRHYKLLGKNSPAGLLDDIMDEYFKPNLFKKNLKK